LILLPLRGNLHKFPMQLLLYFCIIATLIRRIYIFPVALPRMFAASIMHFASVTSITICLIKMQCASCAADVTSMCWIYLNMHNAALLFFLYITQTDLENKVHLTAATAECHLHVPRDLIFSSAARRFQI